MAELYLEGGPGKGQARKLKRVATSR